MVVLGVDYLSHYYGGYLFTSLQTVISSSKFLLWFAWTNEREFFSVEWKTIIIFKPIHLSFTHTVPQSERKKNTNYFQTVLFCYDQSQQRSGHPSKSQNHKKLPLFSTPDWLLLAPGFQNIYPWCSGFSEFHRKLV